MKNVYSQPLGRVQEFIMEKERSLPALDVKSIVYAVENVAIGESEDVAIQGSIAISLH